VIGPAAGGISQLDAFGWASFLGLMLIHDRTGGVVEGRQGEIDSKVGSDKIVPW